MIPRWASRAAGKRTIRSPMRPGGNDLRLSLARRSRPSLYSDGEELSVPVDRVERKLAAIFAADIAGYSRLMARDEVGTLARLKACRAIIDELIASDLNLAMPQRSYGRM